MRTCIPELYVLESAGPQKLKPVLQKHWVFVVEFQPWSEMRYMSSRESAVSVSITKMQGELPEGVEQIDM